MVFSVFVSKHDSYLSHCHRLPVPVHQLEVLLLGRVFWLNALFPWKHDSKIICQFRRKSGEIVTFASPQDRGGVRSPNFSGSVPLARLNKIKHLKKNSLVISLKIWEIAVLYYQFNGVHPAAVFYHVHARLAAVPIWEKTAFNKILCGEKVFCTCISFSPSWQPPPAPCRSGQCQWWWPRDLKGNYFYFYVNNCYCFPLIKYLLPKSFGLTAR